MKRITYIIKIIFIIYAISNFKINPSLDYKLVITILMLLVVFIIKEKFNYPRFTVIAEILGVTVAGYFYREFILLYVICVYDSIYEKLYIGSLISVVLEIYLRKGSLDYSLIFLILIGIIAYILRNFYDREEFYRKSIDRERALRYELEETKLQLLNSSTEAVHIAELNERNRIARNIHDNIGHSIAGIFMQLQVVRKLYGKDDAKAIEILDRSINGLSQALETIRTTVHNIKPKENLGIEYIVSIINEFKYCKVEFKHSGDISTISASHMAIIAANIKEALTNVIKYSSATKVIISIGVNERYIRLYIKDNGGGSTSLKEGLGISGMRDRVKNVGGSISISSEDGFLIVCIIPVDSRGGKIFEGINS